MASCRLKMAIFLGSLVESIARPGLGWAQGSPEAIGAKVCQLRGSRLCSFPAVGFDPS